MTDYAVITGAGDEQGIGFASVKALLDSFENIIIVDLHISKEVRDAEYSFNNNIYFIECDLTDRTAFQDAINDVMGEHDCVKVIVNNAGIGVGSEKFLENTQADWQKTMNVNLFGLVNVCNVLIPKLSKNAASIINMSSLAGMGAISGMPAPYTVSKHAVIGLTKSMALEFASKQIRVNAICPGSVATRLQKKTLELIASQEGITIEEAEELELTFIPMGFSAKPQSVAEVVSFLANDASKYITGAVIPVAGGMSAGL